jgi:hypothetical protein
LGARALDGWSLPPIQESELNAGKIGNTPHDAVKSVNLPHEVAFAQTANSRVTGHHTNAFAFQRDQSGVHTHPSRHMSSFGAGVTTADYNNVIG